VCIHLALFQSTQLSQVLLSCHHYLLSAISLPLTAFFSARGSHPLISQSRLLLLLLMETCLSTNVIIIIYISTARLLVTGFLISSTQHSMFCFFSFYLTLYNSKLYSRISLLYNFYVCC
jgi:hypothetical protein